jgi:hypothetical protein
VGFETAVFSSSVSQTIYEVIKYRFKPRLTETTAFGDFINGLTPALRKNRPKPQFRKLPNRSGVFSFFS